MKRLLLLYILFFPFFNSIAEEVFISLTIHEEWTSDKRSVTIYPTAAIDGNNIFIYSNVSIDVLHIIIKDSSGNIIYSTDTAVNTLIPTLISLFNIEEGGYILELSYEDIYLIGNFRIYQSV